MSCRTGLLRGGQSLRDAYTGPGRIIYQGPPVDRDQLLRTNGRTTRSSKKACERPPEPPPQTDLRLWRAQRAGPAGQALKSLPLKPIHPTAHPNVSLSPMVPPVTLPSILQHLGAILMPALPSSRTTRRLVKLASLGLAGLIAGLLSGCTSTSDRADNTPPNPPAIAWEFTPANTPQPRLSTLSTSLDAHLTPSLRHPPSARRLQFGSLHLIQQPITGDRPRS
jgi:hypothetical protein